MSNVLIYWALPSLVMFLCICTALRRNDDCPIDEWDGQTTIIAIAVSVIYPLGIIALILLLKDTLIKER